MRNRMICLGYFIAITFGSHFLYVTYNAHEKLKVEHQALLDKIKPAQKQIVKDGHVYVLQTTIPTGKRSKIEAPVSAVQETNVIDLFNKLIK